MNNPFELPADKANHLITGALIFLAAAFAAKLGHLAPVAAVYVGLAASFGAGALKELADWHANRTSGQQPHGVEWQDFFATGAGGLLCMLGWRIVSF